MVLDAAHRTVSDPRMRKVMEIASQNPGARQAQLSRIAEIQEQVADAFARRCRDRVTAHALASLTYAALSLVYRVWLPNANKNIDSAVDDVLSRLSTIVCAG